MIIKTGLSPRRINLRGTFEIIMTAARAAAAMANPRKSFTTKRATM